MPARCKTCPLPFRAISIGWSMMISVEQASPFPRRLDRRRCGSRGSPFRLRLPSKETHPTLSRAQSVCDRRKKSLSICFHFLPFPSAIRGFSRRYAERGSFLRASFPPLPEDWRPAKGAGQDEAPGRPHILWLECFQAIAFPGADSIISILCGAVSGRLVDHRTHAAAAFPWAVAMASPLVRLRGRLGRPIDEARSRLIAQRSAQAAGESDGRAERSSAGSAIGSLSFRKNRYRTK
jgi:hypothetical protein